MALGTLRRYLQVESGLRRLGHEVTHKCFECDGTPAGFERAFRDILLEAGIQPYQFAEQNSANWSHNRFRGLTFIGKNCYGMSQLLQAVADMLEPKENQAA